MRKLRTLLLGIAVTATTAIGATFFTASPAMASVWNCQTGYSTVGAYGICGAGDSTWYHVSVICAGPLDAYSYFKYGNWVARGSGTPSTVQGCEWYEHFSGYPWISTN